MTIEERLNTMATEMLEKATDENRIEVFKVVSNWYLGTARTKRKDDDTPTGSFREIRESLNGAGKQ